MDVQNTTEVERSETEVQENKYGIDQVKPVVNFGAEFANVMEAIINKEYAKAMNLMDEAIALSGVDWDKFKLQIQDIVSEERVELENTFKNKFDIADDKLELLIEKAIVCGEKTAIAIESWIEFAEDIKEYKKTKDEEVVQV